MEAISVIQIVVYLLSFLFSMYALTSVKFDVLCNVRDPRKVQLLMILLSMALGYLVARFVLDIFIFY
ncbi:MAG: DUF1146 domain-containing protein [Breznakia sp.]